MAGISAEHVDRFTADRCTGGAAVSSGITISAGSSLRLNKSEVRDNNSGFGPGGIMNRGQLELYDCTVKGNHNSNGGGGVRERLSGGITNMDSGLAIRVTRVRAHGRA